MKTMTLEELKAFDGSEDGKPIYIAYKGKVYDVTESPLFINGIHFEHYAGSDLTEFIDDAPHGEEVLGEYPVVAELVES